MRTIAGALLALGVLAAGPANAQGFTLTSPDVTEGGTIKAQQVFNEGGCTGNDISPALNWSGAPAGTKSFAVTLFDPDAPTGSGFWHWSIFDIPATATGLAKNAGNLKAHLAPKGSIQVRNDYGGPGYGGPARRPARRITMSSRCSRWTSRRLTPRRMPHPRSSASTCTTTRSGKATLTGMYGR